MKQEITTKNWEEISNEARNVWRHWSYKHGYVQEDSDGAIMPMPTIGQMFHYLIEQLDELGVFIDIQKNLKTDKLVYSFGSEGSPNLEDDNLCDLLWEKVKELL